MSFTITRNFHRPVVGTYNAFAVIPLLGSIQAMNPSLRVISEKTNLAAAHSDPNENSPDQTLSI